MKFGIKQINNDPPKWLVNLADAVIIVLGALAIYSLSIPESIMTLENKNFVGATFTFIAGLITAFKVFTGKTTPNE